METYEKLMDEQDRMRKLAIKIKQQKIRDKVNASYFTIPNIKEEQFKKQQIKTEKEAHEYGKEV